MPLTLIILYFIDHGHDLFLTKALEIQGAGATGGHAEATPLAEDGVDLGFVRKWPFFQKRRGRIGAQLYADAATAAKQRVGCGHVSADLEVFSGQKRYGT